jgi:hypothetical protein
LVSILIFGFLKLETFLDGSEELFKKQHFSIVEVIFPHSKYTMYHADLNDLPMGIFVISENEMIEIIEGGIDNETCLIYPDFGEFYYDRYQCGDLYESGFLQK